MKISGVFRIELGTCCICEPVPVKLAKVLISLAHSFNCISPAQLVLVTRW